MRHVVTLILLTLPLPAAGAMAFDIQCPARVTVNCRDLGNTEVTGRPGWIDACGMPVVEYRDSIYVHDSLITRLWTVTDTCGEIRTCTQEIVLLRRPPRVAVLPLENLAAAEDGVRVIARLFEEAIRRHHQLELIPVGMAEDALLRARIRQPWLMDDEQRRRLAASLDAEYFVIGSLLNYRTYEDQYSGLIPVIGMTLHVQRASDGGVVWSESLHAVGNDGEWLFGLGVEHDITRLARNAARRSVEKFSNNMLSDPCDPDTK